MSPSHARSIPGPPDALDATAAARRARGAPLARWLDGWPLTLALSALVAALAAAIAVSGRGSAGALGLAIRATARTSFALFLLAFTASAAHRLWPGRFTRWQRRNRRHLGVAFAASHLVHAASIIALAALHSAAFHRAAGEMSRLPGLVGYGLLLAMAATSFDRTAAWLGPRAWKVLHTVGSIYLWGAFTNAFLTRALRMPAYGPAAALAIAAMALRILAWRRARSRSSISPR